MSKKTKTEKKDHFITWYDTYYKRTSIEGPYTKTHALSCAKNMDGSYKNLRLHKLGKGQKVKVTVELV